jgi:hypothetical protein
MEVLPFSPFFFSPIHFLSDMKFNLPSFLLFMQSWMRQIRAEIGAVSKADG